MEIDEIAARLVRQYWALLVVCVLAPLAIIGLIVHNQPTMYAAVARVMTSSEVPVTASQADAIVSQVQGIATGSTAANQALANAGIRDDTAKFVMSHVSVAGLGTSQVVDVTVADPIPQVAQKAARIVAEEVVASLNKVGLSGLSGALTVIDSDIVRLTEQRAALSAAVTAEPHNQQLQAKLAGLDQVIANFTGDRGRLLIQASTQGLATLIDQPGLPQAPESKALPQKLGLAGLLGLVLGILVAAVAEMIRPTVPGARRVSRRLSSPMLGSLTEDDIHGGRTPGFDNVVLQVRLAAAHAGVANVAIVDIDKERQFDGLASMLNSAMPLGSASITGGSGSTAADDVARLDGAAAGDAATRTLVMDRTPAAGTSGIRVYSLQQLQRQAGIGQAGIVVLSGPVARVSRVAALDDLSVAAGWPIIGVVGVPRHRKKSHSIRWPHRTKAGGAVAGGVAEAYPGTRPE